MSQALYMLLTFFLSYTECSSSTFISSTWRERQSVWQAYRYLCILIAILTQIYLHQLVQIVYLSVPVSASRITQKVMERFAWKCYQKCPNVDVINSDSDSLLFWGKIENISFTNTCEMEKRKVGRHHLGFLKIPPVNLDQASRESVFSVMVEGCTTSVRSTIFYEKKKLIFIIQIWIRP